MQGFTSGGPARETICCRLLLPSDRIFRRFFQIMARWLSFRVCRNRQVFQEKDEWNLSIRRVLPRCSGAAGSSARSVKGRAPGRPLDRPPQCGTWEPLYHAAQSGDARRGAATRGFAALRNHGKSSRGLLAARNREMVELGVMNSGKALEAHVLASWIF